LPNLGAFEAFRSLPLQRTALERLRVQLEAYLSFLCHHPEVLQDDLLLDWLEASDVCQCVLRMVVANALGDLAELIHSIELLDEMLPWNGGANKSCVSPTTLAALTAPLRHPKTSDRVCCIICRILKRLMVTKRIRKMVLGKTGAAGGSSLLLKVCLRGGAVAAAVQGVFEACGDDVDDKELATLASSSSDTIQPDKAKTGKKARMCCICIDKEVTHAFLPCGHNCACLDCAQYLAAHESTCPICRRHIEGQVQIFAS